MILQAEIDNRKRDLETKVNALEKGEKYEVL